jgi:hypothetical protein
MIARWANALETAGGWFLVPAAVLAVALLVPFLCWVIASETRTRHLARLIKAVRGPDDPRGDARVKRTRRDRDEG